MEKKLLPPLSASILIKILDFGSELVIVLSITVCFFSRTTRGQYSRLFTACLPVSYSWSPNLDEG